MLRNLYLTITLVILTGINLYAQTTAIKATVLDGATNETIPFVGVAVLIKNVPQGSGTADINGELTIKPLNPGTYTVQATYLGYLPIQINNVIVQEGKTTYLDIKMEASVIIRKEFVKTEYVVPLVDRNKTVNSQTVGRADYMKMPNREVGAVVSQAGGVFQKDDGKAISVRGGRSNETRAGNASGESSTKTFIDGQRVVGSAGVSQSSIEQITVIISGVPAEFGDATSGVINITTRGPGPNYFGGIEAITSQGLDKFGYNYINFNAGGPILFKKDKDTDEKKPILGFFVGGEFSTDKDKSPSYIGNYKLKKDVQDSLDRYPIFLDDNANVIKKADYLTQKDFELIPYRENVRTNLISLNAKLDFAPTENLNITAGGNYILNRYHSGTLFENRNNSLLNSRANQYNRDETWRVWGRVRQKFGTQSKDDKTASNIKNAFYQIQVGYTHVNNVREDEKHGSNFQDYGYIGKFNVSKTDAYGFVNPSLSPDGTFVPGYYALTSHDNDTLVDFVADTITNPIASRYTQEYFRLVKERGAAGFYNSLDAISANGAFLNGGASDQNPNMRVYNTWYNSGLVMDNYQHTQNTQFRLTGSFNADIKSHAIQLGFEYEQRNDSYYNFKPTELWKRARLLANNNISSLDSTKRYIYKGDVDIIYYSRRIEPATGFAKNIREELGVADSVFVQTDSWDKDQLKITQFSADNLLGGGTDAENLLSNGYGGFDVYGNKLKGKDAKVEFGDYWSKKDAKGNYTRSIGAFKPIYIAGYLQDNFDFRDLKFNVGVRVDIFDAHQSVLKDQYVFFETKKAAEITKFKNNTDVKHPDFIANDGQNYVVYANDTIYSNVSSIYGYRNITTNKWFDKEGNPLADPKDIADLTGGTVKPILGNGVNNIRSNRFEADRSFRKYKAQVNAMPRIAFSFPISDQANFFAHYDVLTQRPPARLRVDPSDYYFLSSNNQLPINNPNLKPEKNIDYELGYAQVLNESQNSAITVTAFYREMKNMINVVRIAYAYPISYLTYGNVDFGTVKGLQFKYDLRRTKNIQLTVNYTLQFAEGTGSSSTDALSLINSNQPNLRSVTPIDIDQRHTLVTNIDYRFKGGADYNGPRWFGTKFFENTGANMTFRGGSGTPYTKNRNISREGDIGGGSGSNNIDGSLNGSRLPSSFRVDLRADRSITLNFGRKDSENRKTANLNIYLQVLNLLNSQNIIEVYKYTGNPNDDGYLSSYRSFNDIQTQTNPQSYIDYYGLKINDPRNYSLPRRIRVGATLDF